jgi:uncharacterized protein (DUF4415 family)
MRKSGAIVRMSAKQAARLRHRGASRTDWSKVDGMSEAALERSIAADADDVHEPVDWTTAVSGLPLPKEPIKLRIDSDVLSWFRATGRGYQTRMNNVLRAFVESRRSSGRR